MTFAPQFLSAGPLPKATSWIRFQLLTKDTGPRAGVVSSVPFRPVRPPPANPIPNRP